VGCELPGIDPSGIDGVGDPQEIPGIRGAPGISGVSLGGDGLSDIGPSGEIIPQDVVGGTTELGGVNVTTQPLRPGFTMPGQSPIGISTLGKGATRTLSPVGAPGSLPGVPPGTLPFVGASGIGGVGAPQSIPLRDAAPTPTSRFAFSPSKLPQIKQSATTPALPKMKPPAQSGGIKPSSIRPHKPRITSQIPDMPDQNRPGTTSEGGVTREKMVNEKGGFKGGGRVEGNDAAGGDSKPQAKPRIKDPDIKAKPSGRQDGQDGGGGRDLIDIGRAGSMADTEPAGPGSDGGGGLRPCLI